jgi:hypothetical protein
LRILETSRAWKERNKHTAKYKAKKAAQDLDYYLRVRNEEEFQKKRVEIKRKYTSNPEIAEKERERIYEYKKKRPETERAHQAVAYALRTGKLVRPKNCQECGIVPEPRIDGRSRLQAHHPDYSKPLEVIFLCSFCHGAINRRHK